MSEETKTDDDLKILSFEEIMQADDLDTEKVPVPEWGGAVLMKTMSGKNRDDYIQILQGRMVGTGKGRKLSNYRGLSASLLQQCLIKKDESPLFTAAQIKDLQGKNGAVISRLVEKAQEMNGLTDDEVEKISGNSETTKNEDDGLTSPEDLVAPSENHSND